MSINLAQKTFGRWTVLRRKGKTRHGSILWESRCDCGTVRLIDGQSLRRGMSNSCGCLRDELTKAANTTHGEFRNRKPSPEFVAFHGAKSRCNNPRNQKFADYGGRGIQFRFKSFNGFLEEVGRKPTPQHSIERKNVNGHYEAGNVCWATSPEQSRNKRNNRILTANGISRPLSDWDSLGRGINASTIRSRIFQHGWCDSCAVNIPLYSGHCSHR